MKRFQGKQEAKQGLYVNVKKIEFVTLDEASILPGDENDQFVKIPVFALLFIGPFLGAIYLIFLPLVGFAMVIKYAFEKFVFSTFDLADSAIKILQPSWLPARAFIARYKAKKKVHLGAIKIEKEEKEKWVRDVEKELDKK